MIITVYFIFKHLCKGVGFSNQLPEKAAFETLTIKCFVSLADTDKLIDRYGWMD